MFRFAIHCFSVVVIVLFCSAGLLSCGGRKNIVDVDELHRQDSLESALDTLQLVDEEEEPPVAVDGLFDDFFFTFVTNPSFQMQRIEFPLPVIIGDSAKTVSVDGWVEYNKFIYQEEFSVIIEDDDDVLVKNDTSVHRVSVEVINLHEALADVYTFRKENAIWKLSNIERVESEHLPNGEFMSFFIHFVNDSTFQQKAIDEPLRVISADDTEEDVMVENKYDTKDWMEIKHKFPLPKKELVNIDYGQPSNNRRHKQLLLQSMTDDLFMKFKFHKYHSDWKLIEIEN